MEKKEMMLVDVSKEREEMEGARRATGISSRGRNRLRLAQDNGVKGNPVMRIEGQVQPFLIIAGIAGHTLRMSNHPMPIMQHRKTCKD